MDWWVGFSQCWPPGQGGCVVWWDAWAAIGAFAAVITTAVLGVVTYRLGKAANVASKLAVSLASKEAQRQLARDRKERILLLMQVTPEISANRERINALHAHLSKEESEGFFLADVAYRKEFMEDMGQVAFPLTEKLADRYHYLDDQTGPRLVRGMGLFVSLHNNYRALLNEQPVEELAKAHKLLLAVLPRIAADLEVVRVACGAAVRECGVDNPRIADAAPREDGVEP